MQEKRPRRLAQPSGLQEHLQRRPMSLRGRFLLDPPLQGAMEDFYYILIAPSPASCRKYFNPVSCHHLQSLTA